MACVVKRIKEQKMKKKILRLLFEEGASGLTHTNRFAGNFSLRRMVADGNAAADAIVKNGGEAYLCDVYNKGRDIINEELSKNAKRVYTKDLSALLKEGIDGAVLIGTHAMNSAWQAFGSYSVNETAWQEYRVNGVEYGDIGLAAMFLGAYNVPVVAVSGDLAAVRECQELVGEIPCAIVKTSKIRAITDTCLPEAEAEKLIASASVEGMQKCAQYKPYKVETPCLVRVLYNRADYCDDAVRCYINKGGLNRVSALVAEKSVEKIVDYNDLRI